MSLNCMMFQCFLKYYTHYLINLVPFAKQKNHTHTHEKCAPNALHS
jgi:hypothetical protein